LRFGREDGRWEPGSSARSSNSIDRATRVECSCWLMEISNAEYHHLILYGMQKKKLFDNEE
jgi:hypothetical protein